MPTWFPTRSLKYLPAALCGLMLLTGCGVGGLLNVPTVAPLNVSGNWQIQSASNISSTAPPTAGLLLLGALSSANGKVTGAFRLANLSLPNACGTPLAQVVNVTGTVDALGNLNLTSTAFAGSVLTVKLLVPQVLSSLSAGSIAITGGSCTFASSTAIGVGFPSVSGTFSGPVTASTVVGTPPYPTGTASLSLMQSATAAADGQFPVTGTLAFIGGTCTMSVPISGTVSGAELTVASAPQGLAGLSAAALSAVFNPASSQATLIDIVYPQGPCNAGLTAVGIYTGTLTRQ
jgi:hypothetical protein